MASSNNRKPTPKWLIIVGIVVLIILIGIGVYKFVNRDILVDPSRSNTEMLVKEGSVDNTLGNDLKDDDSNTDDVSDGKSNNTSKDNVNSDMDDNSFGVVDNTPATTKIKDSKSDGVEPDKNEERALTIFETYLTWNSAEGFMDTREKELKGMLTDKAFKQANIAADTKEYNALNKEYHEKNTLNTHGNLSLVDRTVDSIEIMSDESSPNFYDAQAVLIEKSPVSPNGYRVKVVSRLELSDNKANVITMQFVPEFTD